MKWDTKKKEPPKWHRIFALLPVDTVEGKTVWLSMVWRKFIGYSLDYVACFKYSCSEIPSDKDYKIQSNLKP